MYLYNVYIAKLTALAPAELEWLVYSKLSVKKIPYQMPVDYGNAYFREYITFTVRCLLSSTKRDFWTGHHDKKQSNNFPISQTPES